MNEDILLESLVGVLILVNGWLHMRQNRLDSRLQLCVEKDAFEEVKTELHQVVKLLTEERVENAEWRGKLERILEKN